MAAMYAPQNVSEKVVQLSIKADSSQWDFPSGRNFAQ